MPLSGKLNPVIKLRQQFPDAKIITLSVNLGNEPGEIKKIKPLCEFNKPIQMKELLSVMADALN